MATLPVLAEFRTLSIQSGTPAKQPPTQELMANGKRLLQPAESLVQTLHRFVLTSNTKDGPLHVGEFFQHIATCVDFTAELLRRPGEHKFTFNQILLKESDDHLV